MIGLATGHRVHNYGTKLQAYAMQEIMKSRGLEYEILQFNDLGDNPLLNRIKRLIHFLFDKKLTVIRNKAEIERKYPNTSPTVKDKLLKRSNSIDTFDNNLIIKKIYGSRKDLERYSLIYKAVFCGSDQAWLPANIKHDFYTLSFVPKGVKRLAYAPSFGVSAIAPEMKQVYSSFLLQLDGISVREKSGAAIVNELIGINVPVVLDPTLLVGRQVWDKIVDEDLSSSYGNYIFVYLLGSNSDHRLFCHTVAKQLNCDIVSLPHFIAYNEADEIMEGEKLYDVTPGQFLGLIKNAQFVITDSFHCSAFSMQYHIPFASLRRFKSSEVNSTNSRLYSLMEMFGMGGRIIKDVNSSEAINVINDPIDFQLFDEVLKKKQKESNMYLNKVMMGL